MPLKRASGLWLKDGKNGKYMSGNVTEAIPAGARLLVFRNDHKGGDSDPDYTLNIAIDDDAPSQSPRQSAQPNPYRERADQRKRGGQHSAPDTQAIDFAQAEPLAATTEELSAPDSIPF